MLPSRFVVPILLASHGAGSAALGALLPGPAALLAVLGLAGLG